MPEQLPSHLGVWSPLVGEMCILTCSNGGAKVGSFMGLSSLGTKDFARFATTSGKDILVNISYLESVEVIEHEKALCDEHRRQVGCLA